MEINLESFVTDEIKILGEYKIIDLKGVSLCVLKCGEVSFFSFSVISFFIILLHKYPPLIKMGDKFSFF